jgi:hypothetical protein
MPNSNRPILNERVPYQYPNFMQDSKNKQKLASKNQKISHKHAKSQPGIGR